MTVTMEKTGTNQARLTITVENEEYNDAMQKAYLKVRNQVNIPGFRKGKAPRPIIESFYSEAVFYDEACNIAVPPAYDKAVEEQGLITVDSPDIEIVEVGGGKGIKFTADVTLKPEVKLGQYKGLAVTKPEYPVTDEDVEAEIKRAQERVARWVETEGRPVAKGDRIMLDYSGSIDGEAFPGGTAENQALEIGSGRFIPGFEDQLVGMELGAEADITVTFPEEYHAKELAGKPAVFHVKIREIKGKEVPEIDDEFAKDVSEFDTLEEYRADILNRMQETNTRRADNEFDEKLMELAAANAEAEIPACMVDRQAERMARDFEYRLGYQGIKMDEYLRLTNTTREEITERYREDAEKNVKISLVMEEIKKAENIEAGDEDVEAEIAKMAEARKQTAEEVRKTLRDEEIEYIKDDIVMRKALKLLQETAVAAPKEEAKPEKASRKKKTTT